MKDGGGGGGGGGDNGEENRVVGEVGWVFHELLMLSVTLCL